MFKNYIKIAFRNLSKQKIFSLINIFGLTIGVTCALLIMLWIRYELSYDNFHKNLDNICRVVGDYEGFRVPTTPGPMAAFLEESIPEIKITTRFKGGSSNITYGETTIKIHGLNVEPAFFDVFTFPVIAGEAQKSLGEVGTMVLTETSANKLFGDEDPLGKMVKLDNQWDAKITAIIKDVPKNSSEPLQFEYLAPFRTYYFWREPDSWTASSDYQTWVKLVDNASPKITTQKMAELVKQHDPNTKQRWIFQPMKQIHLRPDTHRWDGPHGDIKYVIIFSLLAIVVISIACINFTNLTIAKSMARTKEIGVRKVVGASRKQLIIQFFTETILLTFISLCFAVIFTQLSLPWFNNITGNEYTFQLFDRWFLITGVILFIIITALSGVYPALYLSSFQVIQILQNKVVSKHRRKYLSFRKILVVSQFMLSIIIIISTIIIFQQINYIHNKKLGFDKENLIYIAVPGNYPDETYRSFKNSLKSNPNIISIGGSNQIPTDTDMITSIIWNDKGEDKRETFAAFRVDEDFIDTYKIKLIQGRNFNKEITTDLTNAFIVNETALRAMNLEKPFETELKVWNISGRIIGVVKDFHFEHLKEKIEPLFFMMVNQCSWMNIRFTPGNISNKIADADKILKQHYPGAPLRLRFMDQEISNLYDKENRMLKIFEYFAALAIIITALGLYGVISFIIVGKIKEVGVRKVLGASEFSIIKTISEEFIILIAIANIIAWPLAYLFMGEWLISFAYRINLTPIPFFVAGIMSFTIAFVTLGWKIFRAARSNPVEALKYE